MAGPYGLGDPVAMRVEAKRLRSRAARLGGLAAEVDSRVRSTEFEGPAANRLRWQMRDQRHGVERIAGDLQQLAVKLEVVATRIEVEIRRRRALEGR